MGAPSKTLESAPLPDEAEPALVVVLCTAPPAEAERIARAILEARVAACVNVVPGVTSFYWWEGEIQKDGESLLVVKTRRELVGALADLVKSVHPYSVPEVVALAIEPRLGNPAYRQWVAEETKRKAAGA